MTLCLPGQGVEEGRLLIHMQCLPETMTVNGFMSMCIHSLA